MNTTTTTWPADVIARYLTVGGATVDIRTLPAREAGTFYTSIARCAGCTRVESSDGWTADKATSRARDKAQTHAETCRAMPKPTT